MEYLQHKSIAGIPYGLAVNKKKQKHKNKEYVYYDYEAVRKSISKLIELNIIIIRNGMYCLNENLKGCIE